MRIFRAPGRANLIGEHTDHTDGLVLPVAIDLAVTLEAELGGSTIELSSSSVPGQVDVPADGSWTPAEGWGRFVSAVAAELAEFGRAPIGLRGQVSSDLPQGAGLSSSAALEVAVALALCAAADLELEPLELASVCRRAERRAVGVPSGIMDQAASVLGRAGHAVRLDCGTLEHRLVPLPRDHRLLVIDSGVQRQLESSAYADRTRELADALVVLDGRRPADVGLEELPALIAGLDEVPARRLRHVVTENARVRATEAALLAGDLELVGQLFDEGHRSLRDDFEVTVPELDTLVDLARRHGATAARMTGAGFGGAIVALVREDLVDDLEGQVVDGYADAHSSRSATVHRCRAADGACEIT